MTADAGTFTSRHKIQLGLGSNNNDAWMLMIKYANYNATVGRRCFQRYEICTDDDGDNGYANYNARVGRRYAPGWS